MNLNRHEQSARGVIVYEKSPYWGPELKRQFATQLVVVHECRSVQDLQPTTETFTWCVILLVLDASPHDCLDWVTRQFRSESDAPIIVVASAEFAELEWILREAGVASFVNDQIQGNNLTRLCRKLLRIEASVTTDGSQDKVVD